MSTFSDECCLFLLHSLVSLHQTITFYNDCCFFFHLIFILSKDWHCFSTVTAFIFFITHQVDIVFCTFFYACRSQLLDYRLITFSTFHRNVVSNIIGKVLIVCEFFCHLSCLHFQINGDYFSLICFVHVQKNCLNLSLSCLMILKMKNYDFIPSYVTFSIFFIFYVSCFSSLSFPFYVFYSFYV